MTGSLRLLRRFGWYRWLVLGVLLAAVMALQANGSHRANAVTHTYQVNSTADTDDGSCDAFSVAPPKDCTLREAINAANAAPNTGVTPDIDIITFLSSVFTVASPGTINLTSALPSIVDDLRINAAGSGVKIDGGGVYDGLNVAADNSDFRFEILASTGHFILQDLAGDGVDLDGNGYSFGIVIIDGVQIGAPGQDVTGDGINLYTTPDVNT
ncbi:MAG: CSLREA domain-containing protein, partial [bacterium]